MHVEKDYQIKAPIEKVFSFIKETGQFSQCIPNLVRYEKVSENNFRLFVTQKFAFLKSNLTMDWTILETTKDSGKLKIVGKSIGSTFEVLVGLKLTPAKDGCSMHLILDISTGGLLKPVPESVIAGAAARLAEEIFSCVAGKCAVNS